MVSSGLVSGAVRMLVPASSANLGPGFDAMGLALQIHDEIIAMITDDPGILIEVEGEGKGEIPLNENHLVAQAMQMAFEYMNVKPAGFVLKCRNAIPHGRGLGSSAAAIIGGLAIARELVVNGHELMSDSDLLNVALSLENHPDNLSASLYGGFTVSWLDSESTAGSVCIGIHPDVIPIVLIPPHVLATTKARGALPDVVPMSHAIHNVSRAGLLVHAMSTDPHYLLPATADRLHQNTRADMYPETTQLLQSIRARGIAAVASGAGPAVLLLVNKSESDQLDQLRELVPSDWTSVAVPVDLEGVRRVEISA
jgi:homoserine kinase